MRQKQEVELKAHLTQVTYRSAQEICAHVKEAYGIEYTASGMTQWLIRKGFAYKKPMKIPRS